MRLWTLHPRYLDQQGLVALWREGLLAQKVLENKTRGYRNPPQLARFKEQLDPLGSIRIYLHAVCDEAELRGYSFNRTKLGKKPGAAKKPRIPVLSGQVEYEWHHLLAKLKTRSPARFDELRGVRSPDLHASFRRKPGHGIEAWEKAEEADPGLQYAESPGSRAPQSRLVSLAAVRSRLG